MEMTYPQFHYYNAADDLISRNIKAGAPRIKPLRQRWVHSFLDIEKKTNQFVNLLKSMNIRQESRLILVMSDLRRVWQICFLGAIKVGGYLQFCLMLLSSQDYAYIFSDSQGRSLRNIRTSNRYCTKRHAQTR